MADVRHNGSQVQGVTAHDSPVDGRPILIGAYASSLTPNAVLDGDLTYIWADTTGRVAVWDGDGSITVDGTVAATQSGAWTVAATQSGTWRVELTDGITDVSVTNTGFLNVNVAGTDMDRASVATLSNVAGNAASVVLLASNTSRKQATIYNDSTAVLYVKFGDTASTTSFTVKMQPNDYYELPFPVYTGLIHGIWASATGSARITELT